MSKNKLDRAGLSVVQQEINELAYKPELTKAEQRQLAALQVTSATLRKGGITLDELQRKDHNELSRAAGLPEVKDDPKPSKRELRMAAWKAVINNAGPDGMPKKTEFNHPGPIMPGTVEARDMNVGNIIAQIGTYSGLGYFVPTGFMDKVWDALAAHDALFDEDCVTVERTDDGKPFPVPVYDDTASVAVATADGIQDAEVDIADVDLVRIGAWGYKGPMLRVSIEAFQDCSVITVPQVFKKFQLDRIARGVGKDLVLGGGTTKPLGLIPSLFLSGTQPIVAAGSSANDGGAGTGSNSIGSADLSNAMNALDSKYWASDKVRWFMNRKTFTSLLNLSDKQGRPLLGTCITYVGRTAYIYGIPVAICPSMDNIGNAKCPIVLGDGAYWLTRLVNADEATGLQIFKERWADFGQVGMRLFARADGALLWRPSETSSHCPFVMLQNHS